MKNIFKRLSVILIAVIATAMIGIFSAACGDGNGNDGTTYTVTVLYPDNTPVDGTTQGTAGITGTYVTAQWCSVNADGEEITCYLPVTVGTDGVASTELDKLDDGWKYHVKLNGVPDGYTFDDIYMSAPGSITIVLKNAD